MVAASLLLAIAAAAREIWLRARPTEATKHDADGTLVGIDIDHASKKLDLREIVTTHIPVPATPKA